MTLLVNKKFLMKYYLIRMSMQLNDEVVAKIIKYLEEDDSIFLESSYVRSLMNSAIIKAGGVRQLCKILGYSGFSRSWSIRQIRYGKQGLPYSRLFKLAEFLNIKPKNILKYVVRIYVWRKGKLAPEEFLRQRSRRF